jgi:hypothetical protein
LLARTIFAHTQLRTSHSRSHHSLQRSARAPLHKLQPVESKGAATQDNETTSGAKAGTESHRTADGLEDNLTTTWPPALSRTKLFNNFEGNSEYICLPPLTNLRICLLGALANEPHISSGRTGKQAHGLQPLSFVEHPARRLNRHAARDFQGRWSRVRRERRDLPPHPAPHVPLPKQI